LTTEIAVLNRLGVALATDSAVTISGGNSSKVFNSADKLFELTCDYPVGVMVNGNMDCVGVPWEIIIKDFREAEGKSPRPDIKQWARELLAYAQGIVQPSADSESEFLVRTVSQEVRFLQDRILRELWPKLTPSSVGKLIRELSARRTKELLGSGISEAHKDLNPQELADRHRAELSPLIIDQLDPMVLDQEQISDVIKQVIAAAITMSTPDLVTGIIVAGYGKDDRFPSISSFELGGAAFGKLRCSTISQRALVSSINRGHVVSFAQNDVIERLLGGADPRFMLKVDEFIPAMLDKFGKALSEIGAPRRMSKAARASRADALREIAEVARDEYQKAAKEMQGDFKIEFEQMIAMMPKIELVEFAEALVNITAIERKATADQGTD
jgi:hypothetical protein